MSSQVARWKNRQQNSETRVRKGLRQDLYRPPRLPRRGGERRIGTVAVWRRLHAPPDRELAARRPETQDTVAGMRNANGRALLAALECVLQASFFLQFVRILSSRCNSQAFPRLFCGESPNGEPFESALLCLSGAMRQAFSMAEAASALCHVGCLFRTLYRRMRPRERFSTV